MFKKRGKIITKYITLLFKLAPKNWNHWSQTDLGLPSAVLVKWFCFIGECSKNTVFSAFNGSANWDIKSIKQSLAGHLSIISISITSHINTSITICHNHKQTNLIEWISMPHRFLKNEMCYLKWKDYDLFPNSHPL